MKIIVLILISIGLNLILGEKTLKPLPPNYKDADLCFWNC